MTERDRFPNLYALLQRMRGSSVDGVPGVIRLLSGRDGPTVGVTACTHGNEPSGLAAIEYLLNSAELETRLKRGSVYLVVNNLHAVTNYFEGASEGSSHGYRFIDRNMNRLPRELASSTSDESEIRRGIQLLPIWERFTVGLDIHSTSQEVAPMIVSRGDEIPTELIAGFPIQVIISNIDAVQIDAPAFGFYGSGVKETTFALEIESGGHTNPRSFEVAIASAMQLFASLEMLEGADKKCTATPRVEYRVIGSIVFPNSRYRISRCFSNFEFVPAGTVLATGGGPDIVAERSCHVLFCPSADQVPTWSSTTEEAVFLAEDVTKR